MSSSQRLVQLAKWCIAALLRATGCLRILRTRRARNGEIPVLWLHRVDGTPRERLPMAVPREAFAALVKGLGTRYRIDSWESCVRAAKEPDGRPRVTLTFDDGYADNAEAAWPILRDAGGSGSFFLTTSFVNGDRRLWWEVIAASHAGAERYPIAPNGEATYGRAEPIIEGLKRVANAKREEAVSRAGETLADPIDRSTLPVALTWSDARRMAEEGATLGGHTVGHPVLTTCTDEELERELRCRRTIEERAGGDVSSFAYPNGGLDDRVVEAVRRAGYTHAFTTEKGYYTKACDPLRIPRIGVSEPKYSLDGRGFSWLVFEAEMLGVFDVLLRRKARRGRAV